MCGHCVQVCPVQAKVVRNDIERAKMLLQVKSRVFVSLAPSYVTEFPQYQPASVVCALKALGFYGISETALGAQEVSSAMAEEMSTNARDIYISSACPTVVELIKKYYPDYAHYVADMYSPVLAHAKLLRARYGEDIGIVFVGPCISKKVESDMNNQLLNVAMTFEELDMWWREMGIDPSLIQTSVEDRFLPHNAEEGAMYPVDGGMVAGIKANCSVNNTHFMTFSGIKNIRSVLDDLDEIPVEGPLFIELLACEGGCVNGPKASSPGKTAAKRYQVISKTTYSENAIPRKATVDLKTQWHIKPVQQVSYDDTRIRAALAQVGKYIPEDELNCGGCGYDSCREFAVALIEGRAEVNMCVGYMRQLAHKKAAALLRSIPSGLVIVDQDLRIVECNRRFADIGGRDCVLAYEAQSGMEGASLKKVLPFHAMFTEVLNQTVDIAKDVKMGNVILHVTVFTIEPHRQVGGIIRDITEPAVQKERIVEKTRQVIEKNLSTVQQIAYLLGENAAESEVILNSIVKSFRAESTDKEG